MTYAFAPYLTDATHEGLIGLKNAKVDRTFGWYSLLMHMFLFKGAEYFANEMDLLREKEAEEMPIQLWSTILF